MKIEQIRLTNYRGHEDLTIDFEPGFNVIVGGNGSGKTSVLNGACDAISALVMHLPNNWGHYQPLSGPDIARLKVETVNGRYRFEQHYPVTVAARGTVMDSPCDWKVSKLDQTSFSVYVGDLPGYTFEAAVKRENPNSGAESGTIFPLIAYYRATRQWTDAQPNEISAATTRNARSDGYSRWWDASLDSSALQGWVIAKCLERFQVSSETGIAFDAIEDDELALVNRALQEAIEGAKGLRYDMKQKSLLVEWQETADGPRDSTSFQNLSHGQRAVVGLIADIARRICLLNPQLGLLATARTNGVVLIDELDMHLHPRWQRLLTTGLKQAFPEMQFIVASHSPQVLGELHPDEIILLRAHGTMHPQVSYGLDSSKILEEIMGADARTASVDARLSRVFEALERNELDQARNEIALLRNESPGLPELAGAEALLRRKEVLGR